MLIQTVSNTLQALAPVHPAPSGRADALPAPQQMEPPSANPPSAAQLESEVSRINAALQRNNKQVELNLSVDEPTKKLVVKLTDKETGETLLQYPSDAVLAIAQGIDEFQQGLLLKQQA